MMFHSVLMEHHLIYNWFSITDVRLDFDWDDKNISGQKDGTLTNAGERFQSAEISTIGNY